MLQRLEESTRVVDVRGVMAAASAYAVLGGIKRVHSDAVGAFPLALILLVYVVAAGAFARRAERDWARETARDSMLAMVAGAAWIKTEAWAADAIQAAMYPPPPGGMNFSIVEGPCFGPTQGEVAAFVVLAGMAMGTGAIPIGWAARWLLRLQQETVDG
jgi:hypothetical protein